MVRKVLYHFRDAGRVSPCPYCNGIPDLLMIEGEDFILRCRDCHAATRLARMDQEEAVADWNAGDILDDHYSITMDRRIDEYLGAGIQAVWATEYDQFWPFPEIRDGFLFSEAVIVTNACVLWLTHTKEVLEYEEIGIGSYESCRPIAKQGEPIRFLKSKWSGDKLLSLDFLCGKEHIILSANVAEQCMMALYEHDCEEKL